MDIQHFESERKLLRKQTQRLNIIAGVLIAGSIIGFIALQSAIVFIAAAIGIVLISISAKKSKDFSVVVKTNVLKKLIEEKYPGAIYEPKRGIDQSSVLASGLVKRPDRYSSEDYLQGTYNNIPFLMSDITLQEKHTTTDSKGHTHTTYETYCSGRIIIFDYARDFDHTVRVIEGNAGANLKGLKKVETESLAFNKKFKTYSSDDLHAFYILTPQIQEKLMQLEQVFTGAIYFGFDKGKMYIIINDRKDSLEISIRKPLDDKQLSSLNSQLDLPAAIINELKLSDDKFNVNV